MNDEQLAAYRARMEAFRSAVDAAARAMRPVMIAYGQAATRAAMSLRASLERAGWRYEGDRWVAPAPPHPYRHRVRWAGRRPGRPQ